MLGKFVSTIHSFIYSFLFIVSMNRACIKCLFQSDQLLKKRSKFGYNDKILHTFSSFSNRWLHNNNIKELSSKLFKDLISLDDL